MNIAIIGTGISGLAAAYFLNPHHDIDVFESAGYAGGHVHTVPVALDGETHFIDTGFIVYNERNYPNLTELFRYLDIETHASDMSFSVSDQKSGLEYRGADLAGFFAQRKNIFNVKFLKMIHEIMHFNQATADLLSTKDERLTVREYIKTKKFSKMFVDEFFIPMTSAIWSAPAREILEFPAFFIIRFFHNHGFLNISDRPRWRVVTGGSCVYVKKLIRTFEHKIKLNCPVTAVRRKNNQVYLDSRLGKNKRYDAVFFACHSDEALKILEDPSGEESFILSQFPYQDNEAVLHTDSRLLPASRRAWASWNYRLSGADAAQATVSYYMNRLQVFDSNTPFIVSLNQTDLIDRQKIIKRIHYRHPLYTKGSLQAQRDCIKISGKRNTYYCGAYWRNGFHEDGLASAIAACKLLEVPIKGIDRDE